MDFEAAQTLKTREEDLYELVRLSGVPMNWEVYSEILELIRMNVNPTAIVQMLKTASKECDAAKSTTRQ